MTILTEAGGQLRAALARLGKRGLGVADLNPSAEIRSPALFDDAVDK